MEYQRSDNTPYFIAGIGLFGVIIGSLITGIVSWKIQKQLIESQENAFNRQYISVAKSEAKRVATDYIRIVNTPIYDIATNNIDTNYLVNFGEKVSSLTFEMALIDQNLSNKATMLNLLILKNLEKKVIGTFNKDVYNRDNFPEIARVFAEWSAQYRRHLDSLEIKITHINNNVTG